MDIGEIEKQIEFIESLDGDDETTHPLVRGALKSLRLVPKLMKVVEAARESSCCDDNDIGGHTCGREELIAALAALDAGEGVK